MVQQPNRNQLTELFNVFSSDPSLSLPTWSFALTSSSNFRLRRKSSLGEITNPKGASILFAWATRHSPQKPNEVKRKPSKRMFISPKIALYLYRVLLFPKVTIPTGHQLGVPGVSWTICIFIFSKLGYGASWVLQNGVCCARSLEKHLKKEGEVRFVNQNPFKKPA